MEKNLKFETYAVLSLPLRAEDISSQVANKDSEKKNFQTDICDNL